MTLKHDPVTSCGKSAPGPDPRIRHRIQIVMFRPIRVDHTNCLQVAIKTHSFIHYLKLKTGGLQGPPPGLSMQAQDACGYACSKLPGS
jgi:hypothetical protein